MGWVLLEGYGYHFTMMLMLGYFGVVDRAQRARGVWGLGPHEKRKESLK